MAELQQQYQDKLNQKEELKQKAEHTELMLDRAAKLVSGLAGERVRWEETVKVMTSPKDNIILWRGLMGGRNSVEMVLVQDSIHKCISRNDNNKKKDVSQNSSDLP